MAARAPGRAVITPITSAMINRIGPQLGRALQDAQAQRATTGYGDFYVLSGAFGSVAITAFTARAIERQLDRAEPPRWLRFRDRSGSYLRVRTRDVRALCESTAEQRAFDRRMARERDREEEQDSSSSDE